MSALPLDSVMRLYIGCALTHVPRLHFREYTRFVNELAVALEKEHQVAYALRDSDPQLATHDPSQRARLCYLWDRRMVEQADAMIAETSFPSTGLGIEVQIAEAKGIPIILAYRDWGDNRASPVAYETPDHGEHRLQIGSGFTSLMVLGLPNLFEVVAYVEPQRGAADIMAAVDRLSQRCAE